MRTFSQRNGFMKHEILGKENMTEDFQNQIYNKFYYFFRKNLFSNYELFSLVELIWTDLLKMQITELDRYKLVHNEQKYLYFPNSIQEEIPIESMNRSLIIFQLLDFLYSKDDWYYSYDFIDFIIHYQPLINLEKSEYNSLINELNQLFIDNYVQYRIVDSKIVPITNDTEINEIERSLNLEDKFSSSRTEIKKALSCLANKENPEYYNSINHSIKALEVSLKIIFNLPKKPLGELLKNLYSKKEFYITYKSVIDKIYKWTNDKVPVRHSHTNDFNEKEYHNEAKLILVTCSTFINYIIAEHAEGNI